MNIIKQYIFTAIVAITAVIAPLGTSAQQPEPYFPLPEVPESLVTLEERVNYLVTHYWDRCNWNSAFSSRDEMGRMFGNYLELLPHADARVAHESIDRLIKELKKTPGGLAYIVDRAEKELYGPEAQYFSDEVFIEFLKAGIDDKKADKAVRRRYSDILSRLKGCQTGMTFPDAQLSPRDGGGSPSSVRQFIDSDTTTITIVFFADPLDADAPLTRMRLEADSRLKNFIADGQAKMIVIYPSAVDRAWNDYSTSLPDAWLAAAAPNGRAIYDIRVYPSFYILDSKGVIHYKNLDTDTFLDLIYRF